METNWFNSPASSFLSFQSSTTLLKLLHYHQFISSVNIPACSFLFQTKRKHSGSFSKLLLHALVKNKGINLAADEWIPSDMQISKPPTLSRIDTAFTLKTYVWDFLWGNSFSIWKTFSGFLAEECLGLFICHWNL